MANILIVDADNLTQLIFKKILSERQDCTILFCDTHLEELEEICSINPPSMLFVNLAKNSQPYLPLIRGISSAQPKLPIYVLADGGHYQLMHEYLRLGVKDFLKKPCSKLNLSTIINKQLTQQRTKGNLLTEAVRELVLSQDFDEVYNAIPKVAQKIQDSFEQDIVLTSRHLEELVKDLCRLINCTNRLQQRRYEERFFFSEKIIIDKFSLQFHLFDIFEEIYRQRSIQKKPQLSQLFDYLEANIYEEVRLVEAATSCQISQSYLSRILKEYYGIGFNTYVQIKKVHLAKKAFYYNDDKIIDVAFQLAYSESSYFCKVFKRIEGTTPNTIKQIMKEERELLYS